ncbi:MAG TPA: signal peptidase II [Campylobacter avium]|uniref:signal peptidase II n=2 Tax=Campylobacter avium TaxID=522485 RepID=UPI001DA7DA6F|nr:signal peptidase II [Campylobacter avium]HJE66555.1 signal peptidase II [Campylobacter avium]
MFRILSKKQTIVFFIAFVAVFTLDQFVKYLSLSGMRYDGSFMSLVLVYNDGVAFSMFAFLKEYLKYIHLALLLALIAYLLWQKSFFKEHFLAFAMLISAGFSNLLDRFLHIGVVDMFFWHKWFEFAVFNVADVMINISVALILIKEFFFKKKDKNANLT